MLDNFFSQGLKNILLKYPKFYRQNKEEDEMLQALTKRIAFPLGQMTLPKYMRHAKIQITSSK